MVSKWHKSLAAVGTRPNKSNLTLHRTTKKSCALWDHLFWKIPCWDSWKKTLARFFFKEHKTNMRKLEEAALYNLTHLWIMTNFFFLWCSLGFTTLRFNNILKTLQKLPASKTCSASPLLCGWDERTGGKDKKRRSMEGKIRTRVGGQQTPRASISIWRVPVSLLVIMALVRWNLVNAWLISTDKVLSPSISLKIHVPTMIGVQICVWADGNTEITICVMISHHIIG